MLEMTGGGGTHLENREIKGKSGGNIFDGKVREKMKMFLQMTLKMLTTCILFPCFDKG